MFAPIKRIMILAAVLMFPGVAFSYVSLHHVQIDNFVPYGAQGFVVQVVGTVSEGDSWESTRFEFDSVHNDICFNHSDAGPGVYYMQWEVPFNGDSATADDLVTVSTYNDDDCNGDDADPVRVQNTEGYWFDAEMFVQEIEADEVVQFAVNKVFRPTSDMDIQVNINCSAGSPGDDSAIMDGEGLHLFPQEFLNPNNPNHDCVITEADVPAGYQAFYVTNPAQPSLWGLLPNVVPGFLDVDFVSPDGCFFYGSANLRNGNSCLIVNVGLPATFTVTKDWDIFQDDAANFVETDELRVRLKVVCNNDIKSAHVADEGLCIDDDNDSSDNGCSWDAYQGPFENVFNPHNFTWVTTGDAVMTLEVESDGYENTLCFADEDVYYSNVEQKVSTCHDNDGAFYFPVEFELQPGGSDGCGFVNTVFFEGIPTLSQYGMAIMALLMLGVGFVGFRRFV